MIYADALDSHDVFDDGTTTEAKSQMFGNAIADATEFQAKGKQYLQIHIE